MRPAAAAEVNAISPVATPAPPAVSRGAIVRRAVVLVGLVALVFGVVLPRLVDYEAVCAAFAELTAGQLVLLGVSTAVAYVASAGPSRLLVPGLSWPHAVGSDLAGRAVASTVPGPTDVATRFVLYRGWSISTDVASAGIALASLFETFSSFALPLIAAAALLFGGLPAPFEAVVLALVGLVVLAVAAVLLISIVNSERLARSLGGWLEGMAARLWTLFRKTPPTSIVEGVLDLRERSKAILTRRGRLGFGAAVVGRLAWFVVLEVALWCVGVGPNLLPPSAVLATMGVVGIVSLVPITPGAVGVAELAYVGILSSLTGPAMTEQLTAAVWLFRIAQWLAPIPIGWVMFIVMRRGHWAELLGAPLPTDWRRRRPSSAPSRARRIATSPTPRARTGLTTEQLIYRGRAEGWPVVAELEPSSDREDPVALWRPSRTRSSPYSNSSP